MSYPFNGKYTDSPNPVPNTDYIAKIEECGLLIINNWKSCSKQ